ATDALLQKREERAMVVHQGGDHLAVERGLGRFVGVHHGPIIAGSWHRRNPTFDAARSVLIRLSTAVLKCQTGQHEAIARISLAPDLWRSRVSTAFRRPDGGRLRRR